MSEPHREPMLRAFFAAPVDAALSARIDAIARTLRSRPHGDGIRWVRPGNYHLTLRFLGGVAASRVEALADAAREELAGASACSVALGAPRTFPNARQPRVIVLAAEPEAPLAALAAGLERAAVRCGFAPEARPFRAHLTLGRLRARRFPALDAAPGAGPFEVRDVVLFRSDLAPDGSRYTPLASVPLAVAGSSALPAPDLSPVIH